MVTGKCCNGWIRVFATYGELIGAYDFIFRAAATCEQTARPAYREMIDTLDWGAIL